jgi:DNA topoisomerase IB
MGKLTVDLKHKKLFVTMDKNNASYYRDVKQGDNHIRPRPSTGRFSDMLFTERTGVGVHKWEG